MFILQRMLCRLIQPNRDDFKLFNVSKCSFLLILISGPRTNNHLEGYHSGLKKSIKVHNPNIFRFLDGIKMEQNRQEVKLGQVLSGGQVGQKRKKYVQSEVKVQRAISDYTSGTLGRDAFLDRVGDHLKLHE